MQFTSPLTGVAATLARQYGETLARLPATVHAFILVELAKWPLLFTPEQRYQRALLDHLSRTPPHELERAVAAIARIEAESGVARLGERDPARFQDASQALLRTRGLFASWRGEVDAFFQTIDPRLEAELYPADAPRRLVVLIYGSGIAVQRDRLWRPFKGMGVRVPLNLENAGTTEEFLRQLAGEVEAGRGAPALFTQTIDSPLDGWIVESDDALHALCGAATPAALTGLSYDRLRPYRDDLTRALYRKVQDGVDSPQAFAAYARSLRIVPPSGTLLNPADILLAFVRDVLITGNGTLLVNNTFVEWATIQALRRAQPRILITRFGVRDKLKPFSSMVLFSQPRPTDHVPIAQDPAGSFIDVEQLSYYIWLNAEKNPAYRTRTLYLFLAEGADEMLAIRSDAPAAVPRRSTAVRLADVRATMAHWLGAPTAQGAGQPIGEIVG
ncbi:MAG TPA: hypothetical protein VKE51_24685 [Vicinamibacterales bacterium]|nr:hypothetical protein [Vicinamibacterales bacterium]